MSLRLACLQLNPGEDLQQNLAAAMAQASDAADRGAELVLLPEFAMLLHASGRVMRATACAEESHPALAAFREFAQSRGVWVLLGSLTVTADEDRIANRSYLIDSDGAIAARYDKIHMFDATLPTGRTIRESALYRPGDAAIVASTPWGPVGLSICYDLRFPQLYRALAKAGAQLIVVPSAFTRATGAMHWHTLLRARAIENACFIAAPATCGEHPGDHATFGHSMIVDPMGRIVAEAGAMPEVVLADVDLGEALLARERMPTLEQDREFAAATPALIATSQRVASS